MSKIIAIDFFCGAGGITKGMADAGIQVIKGIDNDLKAKETYEKNNPGSKFLHADVRKISAQDVMKGIDRGDKKLLFVACAPCQTFSQLNKNSINRRKIFGGDPKDSLIESFSRIVKDVVPDYVFIENVPQFSDSKNKYFESLQKTLKKKGYQFDFAHVNAKDYGVPQNRRRFVLLASRDGLVNFPSIGFGPGKKPYVTVRETISKYPRIKAGKEHAEIPNHVTRRITSLNLDRLKYVPKNGGTRKNWPKSLILDCHRKKPGYTDTYGRMAWNAPAPTMTCKCTSLSNGRFGHPSQNRAISVREAAAIQTFPDDYIFYGTLSDMTKHVGNAVPVAMAREFGLAIKEMSRGTNGSNLPGNRTAGQNPGKDQRR